MLHPSYTDLMETINSETEGDTPVVNSPLFYRACNCKEGKTADRR